MDDGDDDFEDADLFTEAAALGGDDDYDDVSSVRSSRRGGGRQHNAHRTERLHKDYERREVGGGVVESSVCGAHVWKIAARVVGLCEEVVVVPGFKICAGGNERPSRTPPPLAATPTLLRARMPPSHQQRR